MLGSWPTGDSINSSQRLISLKYQRPTERPPRQPRQLLLADRRPLLGRWRKTTRQQITVHCSARLGNCRPANTRCAPNIGMMLGQCRGHQTNIGWTSRVCRVVRSVRIAWPCCLPCDLLSAPATWDGCWSPGIHGQISQKYLVCPRQSMRCNATWWGGGGGGGGSFIIVGVFSSLQALTALCDKSGSRIRLRWPAENQCNSHWRAT